MFSECVPAVYSLVAKHFAFASISFISTDHLLVGGHIPLPRPPPSDPFLYILSLIPFQVVCWGISIPGNSVGIVTDYGLDGPGIESRWSEIFCTCPVRPWGPPSLLYNGYRVFPVDKERPGRDAHPSPLLVPWSRKSRAIPLLPQWAVGPPPWRIRLFISSNVVHVLFRIKSFVHIGVHVSSPAWRDCLLCLSLSHLAF